MHYLDENPRALRPLLTKIERHLEEIRQIGDMKELLTKAKGKIILPFPNCFARDYCRDNWAAVISKSSAFSRFVKSMAEDGIKIGITYSDDGISSPYRAKSWKIFFCTENENNIEYPTGILWV